MKRRFIEHLNLPPLITTDGHGCCVGCQRNIRAGSEHKDDCPIQERQREAVQAPRVVVIDPAEIARDVVASINAIREKKKLEERLEMDRIAAGTSKAQRKRKSKGATS